VIAVYSSLIVCILMVASSRLHKNVFNCRNENASDFSYTGDSDYAIVSSEVNEGENGTSGSETRLTVVSGMRLSHLDSGPCRSIQVQNIEGEALVPSDWERNVQPMIFFPWNLFGRILKETVRNGNGKKIQNMAPSKRPRLVCPFQP
jgi:hypothetical protein